MSESKIGKVVQVIGPVVDIKFDEASLPNIYNEIKIDMGDRELVVEVEQHVGDDIVRAIAMESTDGLKRGMKALDTGKPISVPVGKNVLGRLFNVLGNPIDNKGAIESDESYPIHRPAPSFKEQSLEPEMFETGIKVIDLIAIIQEHIDQGISTTLFVDSETSTKELARYYIYAHKKNLKALYYTRTKNLSFEECLVCSI